MWSGISMVMVVLDNHVDALLYWCPPTKSGSLNSLDEAHGRSLSPRVVNAFFIFFSLSDIANQKTITSKTQVLWKFFSWITVSSFFFKQINIEEIMILGLKISKVDFWSQKSFYCHNFGYVILLKDNIQFR